MTKIHDLINTNHHNLLDNEPPLNKDEKERILKMTMEKIPSSKKSIFSKKKLLVGILVATMMIGTVTMAIEYFESNLDNDFLNFLGIDKNNTVLDRATENVNKSVLDNGLNLSVRQTLGDKHTLYILIDVTAPSNVEIPENAYFEESTITLAKSNNSGWYFENLKDENPNDNKQSYLLSYNTWANLNNNSITLDFGKFGYYSEETNKFITLVDGNWKLSWKLNYKDVSKTFRVNKFIKDNNYKSLITSINISPISISVNLIGDDYDDFIIKSITLKDGTVYKDDFFISSSTSTSFLKAYTSCELKNTINVNDIKSITIGNDVIEINK